jgi:aminopeptidase N
MSVDRSGRSAAPASLAICLAVPFAMLLASCSGAYDSFDSGGPLIPEQAAFDVTYYELDLRVDPSARRIDGSLEMRARLVNATDRIVLDLERSFEISSVTDLEGEPFEFQHDRGRIRIRFDQVRQPGSQIGVRVHYGGQPHVATNPPWSGGFTWATTPDGGDWIATTCQGEGADIWWPVKDHPSDEPDSMRMHFTVPKPLVVASNGRLESAVELGDSTQYNWFVSTPINTYNVTLNAADFAVLRTLHVAPDGHTYPVAFYVLPEYRVRAGSFLAEIHDHLSFYESLIGPYPFRADKYGVVQTPHLGMEHQTMIAYGAGFDNGAMTGGVDWGFDALHHHELAHEWWGNLVTNLDWSDMWLHEGFATYMQALYVERLHGARRYQEYMSSLLAGAGGHFTLAPPGPVTADGIYDGRLYNKGAWVLHTLRYVIGDAAFFRSLRQMAWPSSMADSLNTSSCRCRSVTTEDFIAIVESVSARDLDWFFDLYLRGSDLPRLVEDREGGMVTATWELAREASFPMPIEFMRGDETVVLVPDADGVVEIEGNDWTIDPDGWILKR